MKRRASASSARRKQAPPSETSPIGQSVARPRRCAGTSLLFRRRQCDGNLNLLATPQDLQRYRFPRLVALQDGEEFIDLADLLPRGLLDDVADDHRAVFALDHPPQPRLLGGGTG